MKTACCPTLTPGPTGAIGPEARQLYRDIEIYAAQNGMEPPHLLSQCRSAALQRAMQLAWDTGRRTGLRVRPADPENSSHVPDAQGICWAFDLNNSDEWLKTIGRWVQRTHPNASWGGAWLPPDLPHFQINDHARWISAAAYTI